MKQSTFIWICVAVNLTVIAVALYLLDYYRPLPPVGVHVPATVAPEVKHLTTTKTIIKECAIYVLPPLAKTELELPPEVQTNLATHVVAASRVGSSRYDHTVTTLVNDQTGVFNTLIREEPLALFRVKQSGYAGIGYGFKPGTGAVVRLTGRSDFVQIKAWDIGVDGTLDSDGAAYAGGHVVRRW